MASTVRELVRRRGIDPVVDRVVAVRRLVDEAVAEYDDRSLTSSLPPLADSRLAAKAVYDAVVAGYGPLQRYLDGPTVEEVWINERLTHGLVACACRWDGVAYGAADPAGFLEVRPRRFHFGPLQRRRKDRPRST